MSTLHCKIAESDHEITAAQRIRWKVYVEEEGLLSAAASGDGRETDRHDHHHGTVHFLVYAGDEPVGTVRLLHSRTRDGNTRDGLFGLDLESKVDLTSLGVHGILPAEITRFCVLHAHRGTGATKALFLSLFARSTQLGITHWVAGANMQTDFEEDAALAWRLARERNLVSGRFHAKPRCREHPQTPRRRPHYTEDQRLRAQIGDFTDLELPHPVSVFAAMGARYIGPPVYDPYFQVFALPLVASLAGIVVERSES
jgi:L-ornithine Nalpha-acyltransferase